MKKTNSALEYLSHGWRCLGAGLAVVAMSLSVSSGAESDDFSDGDDAGWTHVDPIRTYIFATTGADMPQNTFTVADGKYRLQCAPTPNPALGQGRVLSLREEVYSNFHIAVDVLDWDASKTNAIALAARVGTPGPTTTKGYLFGYITGGNYLDLVRLQDEGICDDCDDFADQVPINLVPGHGYRFTFTGKGTRLVGRVYDLADLTTPLAEISGTDGILPDGVTGLVVFPLGASRFGAGDATFDNFSATDRERPRVVAKFGDFGERLIVWPTYEGDGFKLQGTSNLGPNGVWTDITDNIFPDPSGESLFFDATGSNHRFFRLSKTSGGN